MLVVLKGFETFAHTGKSNPRTGQVKPSYRGDRRPPQGRIAARTDKAACFVGGSETPRWGRSNTSLGKTVTPVREDRLLRKEKKRPCREKTCIVVGMSRQHLNAQSVSAANRKCKDMNVIKRSSLEFDIIAHVNTIEETKGRVDCGDWRLDREIGRGAYGVVYLATNGKGERAAVKVCRRNDIGEERYERELRGAKLYT